MKHIVLCLDGTWNDRDSENKITNVVRLMRCIKKKNADDQIQITYYDAGVGTGDIVDKLIGGAFGKGVDENVLDGYRFVCNNYEAEDRIYIFGFSRGAYTARSLAGLICSKGLLGKPDLDKVNRVWDSFKGEDVTIGAKLIKPDVECVGVWDTVGALGIPDTVVSNTCIFGWCPFAASKRKYQFHDNILSPKVKFGFHALAIDERRAPFKAAIWRQPYEKDRNSNQVVEQVWFAGVHSDVGGSFSNRDLSDNTLRWMIERVLKYTDLDIDPDNIEEDLSVWKPLGPMHSSMSLMYMFSKMIPHDRIINGMSFKRNFMAHRRFLKGDRKDREHPNKEYPQAIHKTAQDRLNQDVSLYKKETADGQPLESETVRYAPENLATALSGDVDVVE